MFQVSWKKQFVLALGLLVFGVGVYWLEFKHRPAQEEQEENEKRMFKVGETPLKSIDIKNERTRITFTCLDLDKGLCKDGDHSDWELIEPIKVGADKNNINSLVSTIYKIDYADKIDLKNETSEKKAELLKQYGLDKETRESDAGKVVTLIGKDGMTWKVALGGKHPIGDKFFALRSKANGDFDESLVLLVPNHFVTKLDKDLTHWRDKRIVALAPHEIGIFEYDRDRYSKFSGERTDGKWTLSTKWLPALPGDKEAIESFLASLTYIKAKDIISERKTDKEAKHQIWASKKAITFVIQKKYQVNKEKPEMGDPIKIEFYEKKGKGKDSNRAFATASNLDPLYELKYADLTKLEKQLKDFRQTRFISSSERLNVKQVDISGGTIGESELKIAKKDDGWKTESSGDSGAVDPDKVRRLLDRLSEKQISDFLNAQNAPSPSKDALRVRIGLELQKTSEEKKDDLAFQEFMFWKNKNKFYAKDLARKQEAFEVKKSLFEALPKDRMAFFKQEKKVTKEKK